ncbi:MAG: hypothetical protein ACO1OB_32435 [Archangium sp.]
MRTLVVVGVVMLAMTVAAVVWMGGFHTEFHIKRAVERGADAAELGEPVQVFGPDFKCVGGWTCDACEDLRAALETGDRVLTFGGGVTRLFYVRVGADDRVRSYADCGS